MKKIFFLIIIMFCFTGCYDYNELNDVAIISSIGVDYVDGKYETTFEIIASKKNSEQQQQENKTVIITSKNDTPSSAFNSTLAQVDKKALFSHLQVVVLGENVSKKGIKEISNYLFRDIHISNNFYYVIAKDANIKDIFKTKLKNEETISSAIISLFNNQNESEIFDKHSEFDDLYSKLKEQKEDIIIPSITLKKKNIALVSIGIFKKDKLKTYLTSKESQTYHLLKSKVKNAFYYTDKTAISIYDNKVKFDVKDNEITIKLNAQALIKCLNEKVNLRNSKTNKELSNKYSKIVKTSIEDLINKSLTYDSDFLGIDNIYYKNNPSKYKKNIYKDLNYNIEVKIEVNKNGQTFEVID